uniref:Uncharacterized protein n=1 Tax=Tetradesmus obliquus TaxID=3088 RepID=A0A383W8R4_TETOB|eukprot:jgi/Sobl393_1/11707/SZX73562.1
MRCPGQPVVWDGLNKSSSTSREVTAVQQLQIEAVTGCYLQHGYDRLKGDFKVPNNGEVLIQQLVRHGWLQWGGKHAGKSRATSTIAELYSAEPALMKLMNDCRQRVTGLCWEQQQQEQQQRKAKKTKHAVQQMTTGAASAATRRGTAAAAALPRVEAAPPLLAPAVLPQPPPQAAAAAAPAPAAAALPPAAAAAAGSFTLHPFPPQQFHVPTALQQLVLLLGHIASVPGAPAVCELLQRLTAALRPLAALSDDDPRALLLPAYYAAAQVHAQQGQLGRAAAVIQEILAAVDG